MDWTTFHDVNHPITNSQGEKYSIKQIKFSTSEKDYLEISFCIECCGRVNASLIEIVKPENSECGSFLLLDRDSGLKGSDLQKQGLLIVFHILSILTPEVVEQKLGKKIRCLIIHWAKIPIADQGLQQETKIKPLILRWATLEVDLSLKRKMIKWIIN